MGLWPLVAHLYLNLQFNLNLLVWLASGENSDCQLQLLRLLLSAGFYPKTTKKHPL